MLDSRLTVLRQLQAAKTKNPHIEISLFVPYDRAGDFAVIFVELDEKRNVLDVQQRKSENFRLGSSEVDGAGNDRHATISLDHVVSSWTRFNGGAEHCVELDDAGWRQLLRPTSDTTFKRIISKVHEMPG